LWSRLSEDSLEVILTKCVEKVFDRLSLMKQDAAHNGKNVDTKAPPVTVTLIRNVKAALKAEVNVPDFEGNSCWLGRSGPWPASESVSALDGVFRLSTLERIDPTPSFFSFVRLGFKIDKDAGKSKVWEEFLAEVAADADTIDVLQEYTGYLVSGETKAQKFLLPIGDPRSGKSTFLKVVERMCGEENVEALDWDIFSDAHGLETLVGKSVGIFHDATIRGQTSRGVSRLKAIVGEDKVQINPKGVRAFSTRLPTRFILPTNEEPAWDDLSAALAARALPASFPNSFLGRENVDKEAELLTQLPQIFLWARDGWIRLKERGWKFTMPPRSKEIVDDLKRLGNHLVAFIEDCCELGKEYTVLASKLREVYARWCVKHGYTPYAEGVFGRNLRKAARGVERDREETGERRRFYSGLKLA
jgi:putative DNA primase/helicase